MSYWRDSAARTTFLAAMVVSISGCYSYKPIPISVEKNEFSATVAEEHRLIPNDCETLNLKRAEEIAVENNPDFISTYHSMKAAWARFYQSLSAYMPTITAGYEIGMDNTYPQHYSGPDAAYSQKNFSYDNTIGMGGNLLVFDGLMRTMNMLAARSEAKEYEKLNDDAHRILVKSVADTFNSILLAKEQILIARANLDFNRKLEKETEIKYDAGAVALTDVLNFQIRATEAENGLIIARYNYKIAKYALAALLGLTEGDIPPRVKFPSVDSVEEQLLASVDVYLDMALSNRPDLEAARRRLQALKYDLYASFGRFSPVVNFYMDGSYNWNRTQFKGRKHGDVPYNTHTHSKNFDYGMTINWTLFEGGRRFAQVREAQAYVAQQEYLLEEQWLSVISQVRQAYDECRKSAKQLILFRKIQGASTKNRDLVEEEYKAGNTNITRLNEAQTDLVRAQSNLATARINVLDSRAQLRAAVGELN